MIHIGIDLHTTNMVIAAINGNGEVIREDKLACSRDELSRFFASFTQPVQAVVECTSNWYWLSDWCRAHGVPLILAHSKMVKAISYAKVKTDKVDARTLAELLRAGLIPEAYQIQPGRRELRELNRARLRMIHHRGLLEATLWNLAGKYNVRISEMGWRYPGRLPGWLEPQLPASARIQCKLMLGEMSELQRHIHVLEEAIEQQEDFTRELELLAPIPGIGLVNA